MALAAIAAPSQAEVPAPVEELEPIGCAWPVYGGDTAQTVQDRFGSDARMETLYGAEGSEFEGLVLWPDDPARRIEVLFEEDNPDLRVSGLRLREGARWQIAGVGVGDSLARVRELNRKPFTLWGFAWDYGGYVRDLQGGTLATMPGGCGLTIRFDPDDNVRLPDAIVGEVKLSSDDRRVAAAKARVSQLTLEFAAAE